MRVTRENWNEVLLELQVSHTLALDTETTGLRPYHGDRLFAIVLANAKKEFYFEFSEHPTPGQLDYHFIGDVLQPLVFINSARRWCLQNAKFDLAHLANEGAHLSGIIHDTKTAERLLANTDRNFDLDSIAKKYGFAKSAVVEEYVKEHHLWEWETIPGKKQRKKRMFFDRVPAPIMEEYACKDARITYDIAVKQQARMIEVDPRTKKSLANIYSIEQKLLPVVFGMERVGCKVDLDFCKRAFAHEEARAKSAAAEFKTLTEKDFSASPKLFAEVFESDRPRWMYTKKGNPSFDSDVLENFEHPAARVLLTYRDAKSKADFYAGFLYHADKYGFVHPNLNSDGTATGRFSSSEPNFQNLTDEEDLKDKLEFLVRRAIVPFKEGDMIVSLDYKAMEYCMMADYADHQDLIDKILAGHDVHEATAALMGVERKPAKTLNFMLLYGGGVPKLCIALFKPTVSQTVLEALMARFVYKFRVSMEEDAQIEKAIAGLTKEQIDYNLGELKKAAALKAKYFEALPPVEEFIKQVKGTAKERGYIFTWAGRRCHFDRGFEYKAPNALIQGGCADVMKVALVGIGEYLKDKKSQLILTVHDEVILNVVPGEEFVIDACKRIMEAAYPHRKLPMTAQASYSYRSLGDLEDWDGSETRNAISQQRGGPVPEELGQDARLQHPTAGHPRNLGQDLMCEGAFRGPRDQGCG